jgi:hypothetical protein
MFSKQDFIDYFTQIKNVEIAMVTNMNNLIEATTDTKFQQVFRKIHHDEKVHSKAVDEIIAILQKL